MTAEQIYKAALERILAINPIFGLGHNPRAGETVAEWNVHSIARKALQCANAKDARGVSEPISWDKVRRERDEARQATAEPAGDAREATEHPAQPTRSTRKPKVSHARS